MTIRLKCPVCEQKFSWDAKVPWPSLCPFPSCQAEMGNDRADDDIAMPAIRSSEQRARNGASDQVYRQLEQSSEMRAEVADTSAIKITNLRDARNPGEVAAVPVQNDITKVMDRGIGGFQGQNGAEFAAGVKTGYRPNEGARTMASVKQLMGR